MAADYALSESIVPIGDNTDYDSIMIGNSHFSDDVGSEGGGVGVDTVHITSAENADENTIILNMIEFGAGENWGLDYDLVDNFTITLKRMDNGFKIDECDKSAVSSLAWCYVPEDDIFN